MSSMEVDLALNARKFQAGVQDAERELKDFSDVLDDIVDSSENLERESSDAFEGAADSAAGAEREVKDLTRQTERLADEFRDAGRRAEGLGDDADRAADKTRRGFQRAEEGVTDFKDEANSTAREAAASFDGSAESIADAFQEVAANAFAGFGPAGAVAGLAAAAGIGLAVAGFEAVQEQEQASRERAAEWAQTWIDNGGRVLSAMTLQSNMEALIGDQERWAEVQRVAAAASVDEATALRALAGDASAWAEVQGALSQAEQDNAASIAGTTDELTAQALGYNDRRNAIGEAIRILDAENEAQQRGRVAADAYTQALLEQAIATGEATESVDELGNSVYELPDGTTITVDAETGQAVRNLADVESRTLNLPDGRVDVTVSTSRAQQVLEAWAGRPLTKRVTVHMMTQAGVSLPQ